ncbi:FtsK/SpoIIIE family DNA translocase [Clostridium kluyveri]|uniref:Cell division protein FtsK n=1 Tax=Clostridium kluyveri TaxID=1534 RepID=A0A1L5F752_CLOKL|nr:DNA translocase FtsK [Clostridium kluyveri]APM38807.1 cell division protein FtsK [Clostridium kluyveri]UZQ51123.1 DNA translocase FtsK [Clostridium kluyveri]
MSRIRQKKKYSLDEDIKGILLTTLGILMMISVFAPSSSGIVGKLMKKILIIIFGVGAFIFPMLIIFIGSCLIIKRNKITFNNKFYGILLFMVNTLLVIHMAVLSDYNMEYNLFLAMRTLYNSDNVFHGGIIGVLIDIPLFRLFGTVGCYVIFLAVYIISFIMMSKFTIYDILNKLRRLLAQKNKSENTKIEEKVLDENNDDDNRVKNKDFIKGLNKIRILDFMKYGSMDKKDGLDHREKDKVKSDEYLKCPVESEEDTSYEKKFNPVNIEPISTEFEEEVIQSGDNSVFLYNFPPLNLLNQNVQVKLNKQDKKELINSASKLEETLASFGVDVKILQVSRGPSVTRFELQPGSGIKVSKIVNLSDDIALGLAASAVRIEAPIPGKSVIGIEVPNRELTSVYLREVVESEEFVNSHHKLAYCLGKDIGGNCVVSDLTKMPHMLIAGATGSGKSVCINSLIVSLLYKYSPGDVKLLMIDPKVVELSVYNGIPHLLIPVVTDPKKAAGALNWAVQEMNRRYKLFANNGVRNIEGYNDLFDKGITEGKIPFVVIIIDELSDLMMVCPNEVEDYIGRLAQMARAAGMHLVIATQRPSVDVITGVIKANIPSRISFAVSSQIDSRTILDSSGAERLLGKGDMLFYPTGISKPVRIQGAFISETEVEKIVHYIKNNGGESKYEDKIIEQIDQGIPTSNASNDYDEFLDKAIEIVLNEGQVSTSLLQRRLRIGYNRAARIIEEMENRKIISKKDGGKPRQILIHGKDDIPT